MTRFARFALLFGLTAARSFAQDPEDRLSGVWKGDIQTPNGSLELVLFLEADGEGGWTGSADTPAQASFAIPLSEVGFEGNDLRARVELTGAEYHATLSSDGKTLDGTWKQRGADMTLVCTRQPDPPALPEELANQLLGTWEGLLEVGAVKLRLVVELERSPSGSLRGHMISPDQGETRYPLGRVDFVEDRSVLLRVGVLATTFDMTLDDAGATLSGKFRQGLQVFDLVLEQVDAPSKVHRPQEPRPPFPYRSIDVEYENTEGGVTLAGTLTIPEGDGPFPAALLITGSGSQDRNEEIFGHKPFWVIADHLSRRGIAVLRVDDRGVGGTSSGPGGATSFDFAGDVATGVRFLLAREEIDRDAVGLIGHSEGGLIAPMVAAEMEELAYIVLLAGPGVRGDRILMEQAALIMRASGVDEETIGRDAAVRRRMFDVLLDDSLNEEERAAGLTREMETSPDYQALPEEGRESQREAAIAQLASPWMLAFLRYDPAPVLEQVRCPVLALNGELDLQVPCRANLDAIEAAVRAGGNDDVTVRAFPAMNHLFQRCETGAIDEYGLLEETFAPEVLELMTEWISDRFVAR